jgi:FkbH-like protein
VHHGEFSDHVFDRVMQLLGRTNQFNLTTRRHSAETVRGLMRDKRAWTRHFHLTDCYGDNGIVGLVIAREGGPAEWEIDTFLMSCRVIGRRLEDLMIHTLLQAAGAAGCKRVRGLYHPTAKNAMVADFYPRLGFAEDASANEEGRKAYVWDLDARPFPAVPFFKTEVSHPAGPAFGFSKLPQ